MYCPHCGSPADSKFCPTCGKEVDNTATTGSLNRAGFWRRAGATLIDGIMVGTPAALLSSLFVASSTSHSTSTVAFPLTQSLISILAIGVYQIWMLSRPRGQTIGDGFMKIRVVDAATGGSLTMAQCIKRWAAIAVMDLASAFLLIGILDPLWCTWDKQGQTLHDKFAGTNVVRVSPSN